jgi:TonB family protein
VISLLFHALLLSLTFGDEAFGLPGLGVPWRERRVVVPDLRIELVRSPVANAESAGAAIGAAAEPSSIEQTAATTWPRPSATATAVARTTAVTEHMATAQAAGQPTAAIDAVAAQASSHTENSGDITASSIPAAAIDAIEPSDEAASDATGAAATPTPVMAVAPNVESTESVPPADRETSGSAPQRAEPEVSQASERTSEAPKLEPPGHDVQRRANASEATRTDAAQTEVTRQDAARLEAQRLETERREAARIEAEGVEAERREAARLAAERLEAQRQAAAREEAARIEAARLEAARREAARVEAERREAARREAARVEAERLEAERREAARRAAERLEAQRQAAAREEAARIEAERREAERQEAARQAAQRQEAARIREEQEEDARREARRRAMARQLEEEAVQREAATAAATPSATLPLSLSTARRVRLWGRTHPDVDLVQYGEAWAQKIQLNTPVETVRALANRPHTPALVNVAIRSDGSVESVTFEVSSGAADVDEAIRRIVEEHRPYPPFPPVLSRRFDVIEIRRTWRFDTAVRLY